MVLHTPAKTQKSLQLHVSSFFTALPQCSPEGQKMGAIEEERIRGWEGCPEPKTSWFSRKESSKLPVAVFLFWKQLIPGPLPADMIPHLQETTCMNRSRWTVWGFYHCRSDWIPQIQRWAFFFFFFPFFMGQRRYLFQSRSSDHKRTSGCTPENVCARLKCEHICVYAWWLQAYRLQAYSSTLSDSLLW